jgi:hypothetical protein
MEPEWKYLTERDKTTMRGVLEHHLPPLAQIPSGPLYHYTSGENLIRIIESSELWSTQTACLNDTLEIRYGIEELRSRVGQRRMATKEPALGVLFDRLDEVLSAPHLEGAGVFVSCFSEQQDDLSQWRAYTAGEGGYAIRFDQFKLRQGGGPSEVLLFRVEYDLQKQGVILNDMVAHAEQYYSECEGRKRAPNPQEWAREFVAFYLFEIEILFVCLKHPAFAAEREWRLVNYYRPEDPTPLKFRQRTSMMSRHLPLRLSKPLPISGVMIGPCRYPELSRVAVSDLLQTYGYTSAIPNVQLSGIPFRAI